MSDLTLAAVCHIPGNVLAGNWRAAIFVDHNASKQQEEALLNVYTGKAGGPIADLAALIGEVVSAERAPITFEVQGGQGTLKIGSDYSAVLEPYLSASGATTTLADTIFSTVPGAPVFVGKAPSYKSRNAALGINVDIKNHNALQSTFVFNG